MLSSVCLLTVAVLATASTAHIGPNNRIVGGDRTDIKLVPYQISLQLSKFHICGGSILSSRFVLTAASCIIGYEADWDKMHIRAGSTYSNQGGQHIKVLKMHTHPKYNASNAWHSDIGILELTTPLEQGMYVKPVSLPRLNALAPIGAKATVSGWGELKENGRPTNYLHSASIPIQNPTVCERAYGTKEFQRDVHLCAADPMGGQSSCLGDAGGALVYRNIQYGIVSWAKGCARPDFPTVFANVPKLRAFITDITGL